jgi:hypothetical protein
MTDNTTGSLGDAARRTLTHDELAAALEEHRRAAATTEHVPTSPTGLRRLGAWLEIVGSKVGAALAAALAVGRSGFVYIVHSALRFDPRLLLDRRYPLIRRLTIAAISVIAVILVGSVALWWRLASGPIVVDLATPWLTAAIEENLGGRYHVKVGGTQIERDAQGHTAVRLRDIAVRDNSGALVAAAPKAEVGLFGTSLLTARPRAASFRLVDASVLVRIDADGRVNVFAGGEHPLISIAPAQASAQLTPEAISLQSMAERGTVANLLALLAWIGGVGHDAKADVVTGFDGHELTEIGILNGNLTIDNLRSAQQWKYSEINLLLVRPPTSGAALSLESSQATQP